MTVRTFVIGALVLAGGLLWAATRVTGPGSSADSGRLTVVEALGQADLTGFERATEVRPFVFPRDHGPHPGFQTEWWYITTNLESDEGERFGSQWTLFRSALAPESETTEGTSPWATNQAWMGHFALTDVARNDFHAFERFARGAQELAGARTGPFRVWLEDWELASTDEPTFPMRLRAEEDGVAIDLTLAPAKPHVLQGDAGLSRKSAGEGNASYYYSFTRLNASGTVTADGRTRTVSGNAWLDREWSTSVLGPGQVGWDWFAIHFEDGRDLMVYQLRRDDGTIDPYSKGVLVGADGSRTLLRSEEATLTVVDTWRSPVSDAEYPIRWRLTIPKHAIDVDVEAVMPAQELDLTFRYWEGAIDVRGLEGSPHVVGRGYLEMTGYTEVPTGGRTDLGTDRQD